MVVAILLSSFASLSLSVFTMQCCYMVLAILIGLYSEEDEAVNIPISHVSTGIPLSLVCFQCLLSLATCTPFFFLLGAWFPLIWFTFIKIFCRIQAKLLLEGFMMIWRYGDSVRVVCLFIYIFLDLDKSRTYFP